ncbi:MAG: helicase-related protein, partial [Cellulosilyticaceae bacterium]
KIEEYLLTHFSEYGVGRMDVETTSGKEGHSKILEAFNKREINVLVGTQMISKGHDFPNVTLVGVVAADMSLYMEDFRSDERTFQLLTQTLGRAGRGEKKGRVIIQTYNPEHRVIERVRYFQGERFYQEELINRQGMGYPPFTHLFTLLIAGKQEGEVIQKAHMLTHYYQYYNKKKLFRIIGPVPATISKVADEYRWKIVIIGDEREKVLIYGKYCLDKFTHRETTDQIRVSWDIDTRNMI